MQLLIRGYWEFGPERTLSPAIWSIVDASTIVEEMARRYLKCKVVRINYD